MKEVEYVYLIAPVRSVTPEQSEIIEKYESDLSKLPDIVIFNPIKDAPQGDKTGYNIVMSELNFMNNAACARGRIDVFWNKGGKPSEGSRVDIGMAYALGLKFNLVDVFNAEDAIGPQIAFRLIDNNQNINNNIVKDGVDATLLKMKTANDAVIDWEIWGGEDATVEQEWQRIRLGLALGCLIQNPGFKIKMGQIIGNDPPDIKSYPKVIKEIEKRQKHIQR